MRSRDILIIADAVAPLADGESPLAAIGLEPRAGRRWSPDNGPFAGRGRRPSSACPGLARRLRTIKASVGEQSFDLSLYEGRAALSDAELLVIAAEPGGRAAHRGAARQRRQVTVRRRADHARDHHRLGRDRRDRAVGDVGGDPTVRAAERPHRSRAGAARRPGVGDAVVGGRHRPSNRCSRSDRCRPTRSSRPAPAPPTPSRAIRRWRRAPPTSRSSRSASAATIRCTIPASDPALPANYSAASLDGKAECRRALARRCSLALGPAHAAAGDRAAARRPGRRGDPRRRCAARRLRRRGGHPGLGRPRAGRTRAHPGHRAPGPHRRASATDDPAEETRIRAAADAILLGDEDDRTGRAAGRRCSTARCRSPSTRRASRDYLVDYDPRSATGIGGSVQGLGPFEIESAIRRAIALRADAELWAPLVSGLFASAPRWATSAALIEEVCASYDLPVCRRPRLLAASSAGAL